MEEELTGRWPNRKMTEPEDDFTGRRPNRKMTEPENDHTRKRPHQKTTSLKGNLDRRQPQRKTTLTEGDLNGRRPQRKVTSMEGDLNGRRPRWKATSLVFQCQEQECKQLPDWSGLKHILHVVDQRELTASFTETLHKEISYKFLIECNGPYVVCKSEGDWSQGMGYQGESLARSGNSSASCFLVLLFDTQACW